MAKFDLKAAQLQKKQGAETSVVSGTFPARIVQIIDVGDYAFNAESSGKPSTAFTFQLPTGALVTRIITNSVHELSIMMLIINCVGDADDLTDLLDKTLVIDVEANGSFPRITGYSSMEYFDEFQNCKFPDTPLIQLLPEGNADSVDIKANIAIIQTLPAEIKKILLRASSKKVAS